MVFFQENSLGDRNSHLFHFSMLVIALTIESDDWGCIRVTDQLSTSGRGHIGVVIRWVPSALVSVCTDQNPSEIDGAITASTVCTRCFSLDSGNQFSRVTLGRL